MPHIPTTRGVLACASQLVPLSSQPQRRIFFRNRHVDRRTQGRKGRAAHSHCPKNEAVFVSSPTRHAGPAQPTLASLAWAHCSQSLTRLPARSYTCAACASDLQPGRPSIKHGQLLERGSWRSCESGEKPRECKCHCTNVASSATSGSRAPRSQLAAPHCHARTPRSPEGPHRGVDDEWFVRAFGAYAAHTVVIWAMRCT